MNLGSTISLKKLLTLSRVSIFMTTSSNIGLRPTPCRRSEDGIALIETPLAETVAG